MSIVPPTGLPWRICRPCSQSGKGIHRDCTDPFGDKRLCQCYSVSDIHRLVHELWLSDDYHDEPEYDGGLGSRRVVDGWEAEEAREQEARTEKA